MANTDFSQMFYHVFKDFDIPFDEKGSTCGTVRLVQWCKTGEEPDKEKAKIEIRKTYTSGAEEKLGKGYTFSTPEGPSELTLGLIKAGFCETKDILNAIKERDNFKEAVMYLNTDDDDSSDGEMFDMRDLLLSSTSLDDEDDLEDAS